MSDLDLLIRAPRVVTCDGQGTPKERLGVIERGAVGIENGRIAFVGEQRDVEAKRVIDAKGVVMPGLVDPHTHLVFAGSRVDEFAKKMSGVDYRTIAAEGGGIASTVRATRAASEDELYALASRRARAMRAHGTTTIEIKSGYGLTLEHEKRCLKVARRIDAEGIVRTTTTYLGAHAVPPDRKHERDAYLDDVIAWMETMVEEGLADACDVYLDAGAFSRAEAERVLRFAVHLGLVVRAHVGQFEDLDGAQLLAQLGGCSVDHLEALSDAGAEALGEAGVAAVLLPAAWRTLRQTPPDVERLRRHGVRLAVGTDCNPGTSPCLDLPLCAALAVRDAGLTPEEALLAMTVDAAHACNRVAAGRIAAGTSADLLLLSTDDPRALVYGLGGSPVTTVFLRGEVVHEGDESAAALW